MIQPNSSASLVEYDLTGNTFPVLGPRQLANQQPWFNLGQLKRIWTQIAWTLDQFLQIGALYQYLAAIAFDAERFAIRAAIRILLWLWTGAPRQRQILRKSTPAQRTAAERGTFAADHDHVLPRLVALRQESAPRPDQRIRRFGFLALTSSKGCGEEQSQKTCQEQGTHSRGP
jgi:hypothetical protein